MIRRAIADAIEAAKREGHMRPIRFIEKELRQIGDILSPDEEAVLDALPYNGGRKPNRDENGFTPYQYRLADSFDLYWKYIRDEGRRGSEAHALVCEELDIESNVLDDVLAKRRSPVNRILRERGSI